MRKTVQFAAASLASLILGAVGTFMVVTRTRIPQTWFQLSTDSSVVFVESQAAKPGIPFPKTISKPGGRVKFLERDEGIELGYVITVPIEEIFVSTLPEKYRKALKLKNGREVDPPEQVVYYGHFDFALKDADGFALMALSGNQENLFAGHYNVLQGVAKKTVPLSVAKGTKKIFLTVTIDRCTPCDSD